MANTTKTIDVNKLQPPDKISKGLLAEGYYVVQDGVYYYAEKEEVEGSTDSIIRVIGPKKDKSLLEKISNLLPITKRSKINKNFKDLETAIDSAEKAEGGASAAQGNSVTIKEETPEIKKAVEKKVKEAVAGVKDKFNVKKNKNDSKKEVDILATTRNDGFGYTYSPWDGKIISANPNSPEYKNTMLHNFNDKTMFNRFQLRTYQPDDNPYSTDQFMVFFTKPDIFNTDTSESYKLVNSYSSLTDAKVIKESKQVQKHSYVIDRLSSDFLFAEKELKKTNIITGASNFIPFLSNKVKNMPTNSLSLESVISLEGMNDSKISLPDRITESQYNGTVNFTFSETDDLKIWKLFNYWVKFMDAGRYGILTPNSGNIYKKSLTDSMYIPYTTSMYCFLLGNNNEIKYFCRYGGAYPLNIPSDLFELSRGDSKIGLDIGIDFQFNLFEEFNQVIIDDFNKLFGDPKDSIKPPNSLYAHRYNITGWKEPNGKLYLTALD